MSGNNKLNLPPVPSQFIQSWNEIRSQAPLNPSDYLHAKEGSRNDSLYKLACSYLNKHSREKAWELVQEVNNGFEPPLGQAEVKRIFDSAVKFVTENPFTKPSNHEKTFTKELATTLNNAAANYLHGKPTYWDEINAPDLEENWVWENYIALGNVTLLTAIMKSGKSTFLRCLLEAMGSGEEIAGQPTKRFITLVISEESNDIWQENRKQVRNLEHISHVMVWVRPIRGKPNQRQWDGVIDEITTVCLENGVKFVIVDTLTSFWPIDNENDSAQVSRALSPLHKLTEEGIAVLLVHHDRKGGGDFGESSRGSSALTGWVDNIIQFKRLPDGLSNQRQLKTWGRFSEVIPSVIVEYTNEGSYIAKGNPRIVSKKIRVEKTLDYVKQSQHPVSAKDIHSLWMAAGDDISLKTIQRYLNKLKEDNLLKAEMKLVGKRMTPFYFPSGWKTSKANQASNPKTPTDRVVVSSEQKDDVVVSNEALVMKQKTRQPSTLIKPDIVYEK